MSALSLVATRLLGRTELKLECLRELTLTASLSSPAMALHCTALVETFPGELGQLVLRDGGAVLFDGRIDSMSACVSSAGRTLTLEARSAGAALLDNEAMPRMLTNLRLQTAFSLFCAPYGLRLRLPQIDRALPMYTVHKGMTEWEALCGFVCRMYGRSPHVWEEYVSVDPPSAGQPLVVGIGGQPFSRLEQQLLPYSIVSKVVLRNSNGAYTSAVPNPAADYYGITRTRYVIPQSEFMDNPGLDADQRIRRSMLGKERLIVTLPGWIPATPGQQVHVRDRQFPDDFSGMMAEEIVWRRSRAGIETTLQLLRRSYYD